MQGGGGAGQSGMIGWSMSETAVPARHCAPQEACTVITPGAVVGQELCAWSADAVNRAIARNSVRMDAIRSIQGNRPAWRRR